MSRTFMGWDISETARKPSRNIWGDCPWLEIMAGHKGGVCFHDDFLYYQGTDNIVYDQLAADATVTLGGVGTVAGGLLRLGIDATDNNEVYVGSSVNSTNGPIQLSIDANAGNVWWEARARCTAVTDFAIFLGLASVGAVAANFLTDNSGAVSTTPSVIGFRILTADPTGLDATYNTGAGTETVLQESATGLAAQTIAANTYFKVGLKFDGARNLMFWFVNGAVVNPSGLAVTGTNFPDGVALQMMAAIKTGEAVAKNLDIDWWRYAYVID